MPTSARALALMALEGFRRRGGFADEILDALIKKHKPDARETALGSRIFYSVLQNMAYCDFHIARHSTIRPEKMEPKVLDILRIGVCQLLFFDRIPDFAAVAESVNLCKSGGFGKASGLVNAVLRRVGENKTLMPSNPGTIEHLTVRYSAARWLVEEYVGQLGMESAEQLLAANNEEAPVTAQVNTLKTDAVELVNLMAEGGVEAVPHPWLTNAVDLRSDGNLTTVPGFGDGLFYVQDAAARLAVKAAGLKPGMRVLDACAAPGGKSFAAALDMAGRGEIVSCDIHERKLRHIEEGAKTLGFSIIAARQMDARDPDESYYGCFDAVLIDVPCSGLGVIRKKPDIRYKDPKEFEDLPSTQLQILEGAARCVKPGGVLLYSTCTTREAENQAVTDKFLASTRGFRREEFSLPGVGKAEDGMITLWPHSHGTDGFYICKFRKDESHAG